MSGQKTAENFSLTNKLNVRDYLAFVKGEVFKENGWFYKETTVAPEIHTKEANERKPDQVIIYLRNAELETGDATELLIDKLSGEVEKVSFVFYSCTIPVLHLRDCKIGELFFYSCRISSIHMTNCHAENIKITNHSESGFITIDNSKTGNLEISNSKTDDIRVNNSRLSVIAIEKGGSVRNIDLENNSETYIDIHQSVAGKITVDSSKCLDLRISINSKCGDISIYNSIIDELVIYYNTSVGGILIKKGIVQRIAINKGSAESLRVFSDCTVLHFSEASIALVNLTHSRVQQLIWDAGSKGEIYVDNSRIYHLKLYKTTLSKDTVLSIVDTKIYILQLEESLIFGSLILRNISPLQQTNEEYNNLDVTVAKEINDKTTKYPRGLPIFRIANSSMGKTEITGSDLSGFKFEYKDSKLLECFITGTKLPKERIAIFSSDKNNDMSDKEYYEQKVSIYNQFKRIFEQEGDTVEASVYHAKAMANQERLLSIIYQERQRQKWPKWWSEDGFDLFNFKLNKWSNNHGESWRRAIVFSATSLLLIYSLYFICVNFRRELSFAGSGEFIGYFFSFLDITHKLEYMVELDHLNTGARIFDFVGRIATGYCIYQFVAAFRRHGRKSGS